MTSHGLGQPALIQSVCVTAQRGWRDSRDTDCSRLAELFGEAVGEPGLISCSNALHFLSVGSAVGSWSASLETRYNLLLCTRGEPGGCVGSELFSGWHSTFEADACLCNCDIPLASLELLQQECWLETTSAVSKVSEQIWLMQFLNV